MGLVSQLLFCAVTSLILPLKVELTDYPHARCNDGSTAVYYFKAGSDPYLWLVNLQGGGWCWNDLSCAYRCQRLALGGYCGSNSVEGGFLDQLEVGGIFEEREDNPMKDANKVFVKYCSSDAWMGRAESGPLNKVFKGSYIVEAVFEDLVSRFDLGADKIQPTTVVFGGQSAGGRGAMVNLDHIHNLYASNSDLDVNVVGWLDSPLWLPMTSPYHTSLPYIEQTEKVYEYANNMEILRQDCLDEYPDTPYFCMFGSYTLPFVKTRSVLVSALYDTHQLNYLPSDNDLSDDEYQYAETFANTMADTMRTLADDNPNLYIFGPACCNHAESNTDAFYDMQYSSSSEATMLSRLLSSSDPPRALHNGKHARVGGPLRANFAVVDDCTSGMTNDVCCGDVGITGNTCTGSTAHADELQLGTSGTNFVVPSLVEDVVPTNEFYFKVILNGFAFVGLIAITYGLYSRICSKKQYDEINQGLEI